MHIEADPQVRIIKNRAPPQRPLVSVTVRASGTQVRIAFNADLVRQASLQDVRWMAIVFDEKHQRVTFISTPSREYQGSDAAYPLMRDGGRLSKKAAGKALNVPPDQFIMLYRQAPRRYEPQIQPGRAGPEISIDLEPAPASYAHSEALLGDGGQTEAKRRAAPLVGKRSEVKRPKLLVGSRETAEPTQYRARTATEVRTPSGQPTATSGDFTKVFVVHGHDGEPKAEVARFIEQLGFKAVVLHELPNRGRTIITKFREVAAGAGFAVILMTPDDHGGIAGQDPRPRARQNVIFELGFFIGALGPDRVAALVKGGVERPSDFEGVGYTELDASGAWKQALGQELQAAGFKIDWNKVMAR